MWSCSPYCIDAPPEIRPLAPLVHPATLNQYNEFGQRVDHLHTSEGWRQLEKFAVKEGYAAIAYERKYREYSRTFQFTRTMVMTGDCHAVSIYHLGWRLLRAHRLMRRLCAPWE